MTDVTVTLRIIRDRIATAMVDCGRKPADIRLVAVSKTHSPETVRQAIEAGQHEFAENYLQEASAKIQTLGSEKATWHYIGRIQSRKTRDIASHFDWVQSVDRSRVIARLGDQRPAELAPLQVLLQVRLSADPARPGADPEALRKLADEAALRKKPRSLSPPDRGLSRLMAPTSRPRLNTDFSPSPVQTDSHSDSPVATLPTSGRTVWR